MVNQITIRKQEYEEMLQELNQLAKMSDVVRRQRDMRSLDNEEVLK